ncbi:hypothetical protein MMKA1_08970 [Methanococcus maripaludis KA1]|uniref:Immunity protein 40 domain-containing protein n=1 Tax=Methanococcus maripaludis KA1 TaxID=637914 RepID=A0A2Z5PMK5_METMI|nr:Imm40 family immunity protein [Methanococcus maripaludis]BAP61014.1 hypothetical protein MMKA1_08970 [Methanococcus maripaludis KA1]
MNIKYGFPQNFPENLLQNGVDLKKIGIYNFAWGFADVITTIEFLTDQGFIILGGDVFSLDGENIESIGDGWYFENKYDKEKTAITESKKKAISYIKKYKTRNLGETYLYSIVFKDFSRN